MTTQKTNHDEIMGFIISCLHNQEGIDGNGIKQSLLTKGIIAQYGIGETTCRSIYKKMLANPQMPVKVEKIDRVNVFSLIHEPPEEPTMEEVAGTEPPETKTPKTSLDSVLEATEAKTPDAPEKEETPAESDVTESAAPKKPVKPKKPNERNALTKEFVSWGMDANRANRIATDVITGKISVSMAKKDWQKFSNTPPIEGDALSNALQGAVQEDKEKKAAVRQKKKAEADAKKKKKGPGVIQTIIDFISDKKKPKTKKQILAHLVKTFPDREEKGMMGTINCQVPKRLRNDKKLNVIEKDGKFFIKYPAKSIRRTK